VLFRSNGNSIDKRILVEELLNGIEFSVESITHNSETEVIAITRKKNTGKPRFVEIQHSQPSALDDKIEDKIKEITKKALKVLGIKNSPSHTELMIVDGNPYIIEIGARLGGDYITSHLVPLSTGYDIVKESVKNAMGIKPLKFINRNRSSLIYYFDVDKGIFNGVKNDDFVKQLEGVVLIEIFKNKGDLIGLYENSNDRLGCVIIEGDNLNKVFSTLKSVMQNIEIEILK
jgi:carbamoylphosphate synthase large subunit